MHTYRWIWWGYFLRNIRVSPAIELRHNTVSSQGEKMASQPDKNLNLTWLRFTSYLQKEYIKQKESWSAKETKKIRILLGNADNIHSNQSKELDALLTWHRLMFPFERMNSPIFHYLLPLNIWVTLTNSPLFWIQAHHTAIKIIPTCQRIQICNTLGSCISHRN